MSNNSKPFSIVTCQDGSVAAVRSDPRAPRILEVVAVFFEAERARDYAAREDSRSAEHTAELTETPTQRRFEPTAQTPELSARQSAVLGALRAKMDANKQVEAKAAVLAEAANVPLGSLHAVLQSLEKKRLIKTVRARLDDFLRIIAHNHEVASLVARPTRDLSGITGALVEPLYERFETCAVEVIEASPPVVMQRL